MIPANMNKSATEISLWKIIEKSLTGQGYTPDMMSKVKSDLESLAKANHIEKLLEKLSDVQKEKLSRKLNSGGIDEDRKKITVQYITTVYPAEVIAIALEESAKYILSKYTEHLIQKIKNSDEKRQLLELLTGNAI